MNVFRSSCNCICIYLMSIKICFDTFKRFKNVLPSMKFEYNLSLEVMNLWKKIDIVNDLLLFHTFDVLVTRNKTEMFNCFKTFYSYKYYGILTFYKFRPLESNVSDYLLSFRLSVRPFVFPSFSIQRLYYLKLFPDPAGRRYCRCGVKL